jgi:kinesin family protein 3/17
MAEKAENVLVVGRCRPFSEKEMQCGHTKIVEMNKSTATIILQNPKTPSDIKTFSFDAVFDEESTQVCIIN